MSSLERSPVVKKDKKLDVKSDSQVKPLPAIKNKTLNNIKPLTKVPRDTKPDKLPKISNIDNFYKKIQTSPDKKCSKIEI